MDDSMDKHWKVRETEKAFAGKWIHVNLDGIELKDGSRILFEAIEFQRHGTGVAAESPDGKIMLVKNYRYINDCESWEVPAGTIPPGMSHRDCIREELMEEAGCTVEDEDLTCIGMYHPSIGSSNQEFHCYIARNVKQVSADLDANEILEAKWFSKDEVKDMIVNGVIKDGFTLYLMLRLLYVPS